MSEEILTCEDKDKLRKQLELLQKEYERTAQRLQRAERRESVRRHVQKTISDQTRLLQINTPAVPEQSSSSSLGSTVLPSNLNLPLEATKVHFDPPEGLDASPFSSLKCKRSPSLRLRSKRSRLRLQTKEKESDTDESQEKKGEESREEVRCNRAEKENLLDMESVSSLDTQVEEKKQEAETIEEEIKQGILEVSSLKAIEMQPSSQFEAIESKSHSSTATFISACPSNKSNEMQTSTQSSDFLSSCTLIEGLPFPVEYYVRTTRRMASSHSTVDINAVIQSQLYRGRSRQRSVKSQVPDLGHVTSLKNPRSKRSGPGRHQEHLQVGDSGSDSSARSDSKVQVESQPACLNHGPDFKHLSDSQLYLDSQIRPDFRVRPVSRKKCGQAGPSQSGTQKNEVPRFLPLLSFPEHSNILDVQEFHLPDDEFGLLKLERLWVPSPNLEAYSVKKNWKSIREAQETESECFERLQLCSTTPENSSACVSQLTSTDQPQTENEIKETRDDRQVVLQPDRNGLLNFSLSLTSHTQVHSGAFISLGSSPNTKHATPPSFLDFASPPASFLVSSKPDESKNITSTSQNDKSLSEKAPFKSEQTSRDVSETQDQPVNVPEMSATKLSQDSPGLEEDSELGSEPARQGKQTSTVSELESENQDCCVFKPVEVEPVEKDCQSFSEEQISTTLDTRLPDESLICTETTEFDPEVDPEINTRTQTEPEDQIALGNMSNHKISTHSEDPTQPKGDAGACSTSGVEGTRIDAIDSRISHVQSCGVLQKTHTFKGLDGGCVLDVCVVRWSTEDWCVCVAGEWCVCVWTQKADTELWDLLHTWTFTQSVISLQEVPDSYGLLCVTLGRLEIMEARILCCPGLDGPFSQVDLCKDTLQAVVAVPDCRVTCCSPPGPQQIVQVFTLAQNGSVAEIRPLESCSHGIQTLVIVEGEKNALLGWTECENLLIWNIKSGKLLQTIRLSESTTTATCLRGYSHRGALCVLLQQASACDDDPGSALFTLIATNPLTGKHFTLISITNPTSHTERLMDGDTCELALAGVFLSGHLAIWDLRRGASCVFADKLANTCRLARWAGPNVLLTGYLNGNVNLYQYKPVY